MSCFYDHIRLTFSVPFSARETVRELYHFRFHFAPISPIPDDKKTTDKRTDGVVKYKSSAIGPTGVSDGERRWARRFAMLERQWILII